MIVDPRDVTKIRKRFSYPDNLLYFIRLRSGEQRITTTSIDALLETAVTEREKDVILSLWKDKATYDEVGMRIGVSRERVHQIAEKAGRKLALKATQWERGGLALPEAEARKLAEMTVYVSYSWGDIVEACSLRGIPVTSRYGRYLPRSVLEQKLIKAMIKENTV